MVIESSWNVWWRFIFWTTIVLVLNIVIANANKEEIEKNNHKDLAVFFLIELVLYLLTFYLIYNFFTYWIYSFLISVLVIFVWLAFILRDEKERRDFQKEVNLLNLSLRFIKQFINNFKIIIKANCFIKIN